MKQKVTYSLYRCPNCNTMARELGKEPWKCKVCGATICSKCWDFGLCKNCRRKLSDEEYQDIKASHHHPVSSFLLIVFAIFDVVCLVLTISGILFSNTQRILWAGAGLLVGLLPTLIIYFRLKKQNEGQEAYYKYLKDKFARQLAS
jgi:hypothetical protein